MVRHAKHTAIQILTDRGWVECLSTDEDDFVTTQDKSYALCWDRSDFPRLLNILRTYQPDTIIKDVVLVTTEVREESIASDVFRYAINCGEPACLFGAAS